MTDPFALREVMDELRDEIRLMIQEEIAKLPKQPDIIVNVAPAAVTIKHEPIVIPAPMVKNFLPEQPPAQVKIENIVNVPERKPINKIVDIVTDDKGNVKTFKVKET